MKTTKPPTATVYVQAREKDSGNTDNLTLYETDACTVIECLRRAAEQPETLVEWLKTNTPKIAQANANPA